MAVADKFLKAVKKSVLLKEYTSPLDTGTHDSYQSALKSYFKFLRISTTKDMDNYFKSKRNIKNDFIDYVRNSTDNKMATFISRSGCIRRFLEYNDITFTEKEKRDMKRYIKPYTHKISDEYTPNKHDIKRLLLRADIRMKTFILMLSSSGMRRGELMKLQLSDIHLDDYIKGDPLRLYLRDTKNGTNRVCWISPEAVESLQEWLLARDSFLLYREKRAFSKGKKAVGNRLFPYHNGSMARPFTRLTKKVDMYSKDKVTGLHKLSLHQFRKFFNSQLKFEAKLPERVVEILMGHIGYLNGTYDQITEQRLFEYYKEGLPALLINEGFVDNQNIKDEIQDLKQEMLEQAKQLKELRQFIIEGDFSSMKT